MPTMEGTRVLKSYAGEYDFAMPLLALDFPAQAVAAMSRAVALGAATKDGGVAAFFVRAGAACEERKFHATARAAYEAALAADPSAETRGQAERGLAELRANPASPDEEAAERYAVARRAQALTRLRRSCPALRAAAAPK